MSETRDQIDILRIMNMIPHRYPFLMVDKVVDLVPGQSAVGIKNVTINEPHFAGHFPGFPVMPGVLIIEAMAQTAGLVVVEFMGLESKKKIVYFMTIDNARFRKPVTPGDTLHIHVEKVQSRGTVWKFKGEAKVGDKLCAEATFSAMIADAEEQAKK
ncbi:MAG: 3-hydroxyacyl-ACP dehydratase FabZ [Alphaproteobacteria bacterium]|jgi:3-hydroxyacyl-[acyl-carrier-protein] dehydratase|nr:3-hydroxyacyl-ACP dehydratase FabZ [Alphaproteobacteria bacterium]MBK9585054.1 3-hydroxyacyl-ACP dehydratase FabZ [Alphaproteobacteria bacterium]MBP7757751.1 3-hydroxyacyl-ACP dehydratase FabZ [Alphaproteobacteria bacterium]MBP7761049.1 3-hydroxyacyl-ACP dehydratase FabZ [Alphaproteobacteria bacterium]MBP7904577.1 3-hydroxyacyl-ACP dehydratase FabZ [Alphaproteobacteria bacterium]